jgi:hypothetical protein
VRGQAAAEAHFAAFCRSFGALQQAGRKAWPAILLNTESAIPDPGEAATASGFLM